MVALGAAVDLLDLIGIREVEARVQALAGRAKQRWRRWRTWS